MDAVISPSEPSATKSPTPASPALEPALDLSGIPSISVISAHFKNSEEKELKDILRRHNASLAPDASRASIFIGKVGTKRRAEFELRSRKFKVEEIVEPKRPASPLKQELPSAKKRRLSGSLAGLSSVPGDRPTNPVEILDESETESETEDEEPLQKEDTPVSSPIQEESDPVVLPPNFKKSSDEDIVWVIRSDWIEQCVSNGRMIPLGEYLVLKARVIDRPTPVKIHPKSIKAIFTAAGKTVSQTQHATRPSTVHEILDRAKSDASSVPKQPYKHNRTSGHGSRRFEGKTFASAHSTGHAFSLQPARLLEQTTSDHDGDDSDLPKPPDWVEQDILYACQRLTPANSPNEDFIEQLKKIRTARTLIDDQIGVRAYSTIIASIAAYPFKLSHPREVLRLPGCDGKTAVLFVEWKNTGKIQAVEDYENDEAMKVLRTFYDIWGVGAKTARQFYYNNHWTELDDIIEFGWNDLDRVQQIGLKYYEEFLVPIPRAEVEQIASVVQEHAVRLRDDRITVTIVGGYRRGKATCGDVDMIVSHPDLEATAELVKEIVEALEDSEWITHTLTMSLHNTHRGQNTLPFRSNRATGAGFDTLDKALVVWQDPSWPSREEDLAANPSTKNPNIHRRVDIIVSPWRTVGCAVTGWSGGTTFQRDLRRYAKKVKGWKFDSSGIRSRHNGEVVQIEGPGGVDGTPEDAERKVFEGLGLEYIPPEFRCTN